MTWRDPADDRGTDALGQGCFLWYAYRELSYPEGLDQNRFQKSFLKPSIHLRREFWVLAGLAAPLTGLYLGMMAT